MNNKRTLLFGISGILLLSSSYVVTTRYIDHYKRPVGLESVSSIKRDPLEFLKKYIPENPVILEAGAFDGSDTAKMATLWPQGFIYAFEPVPENFEKLRHTTVQCANVRCYPAALSNECGKAQFHVSECNNSTNGCGSLLMPTEECLSYAPTTKFEKIIEVPTITLDKWAEEQQIDHIDLLWLDMQGHELTALKASPKILSTVKAIYTEVSFVTLYEGQSLFQEVKEWLAEQGFEPVACDSGVTTKSYEANVIFARKNDHVERRKHTA